MPTGVTVWERNFSKGFSRSQVAVHMVLSRGSNRQRAGKGPAHVPPGPLPQITALSALSEEEIKPSVCREMPAHHSLMARSLASPVRGPMYGATQDGSSRQKLCRSRLAGHGHSPQCRTNLVPSEPTQVLKAKC